jgi:hypothetical protein
MARKLGWAKRFGNYADSRVAHNNGRTRVVNLERGYNGVHLMKLRLESRFV